METFLVAVAVPLIFDRPTGIVRKILALGGTHLGHVHEFPGSPQVESVGRAETRPV